MAHAPLAAPVSVHQNEAPAAHKVSARLGAPRGDTGGMTDTADRLEGPVLAFVDGARRAILGTVAPDGRPRLVPVCFAIVDGDDGRPWVYSPLDDKPKRIEDPMGLARVRDILARPQVTLLVDRWDEDWRRLAWARIDGRADLLAPDAGAGHPMAVARLRDKHPQYRDHALDDRPLLRIAVERVTWWGEPRPSDGP
jgi:PPOX class probable F420-dependent enzyme